MRKPKRFSIECVNRVKLEKVEEFQDSIFSDVYRTAHMQIERVVGSNDVQGEKKDSDAEKFCNGNEMSNVISFVGERGMGKSSAMLSFAYFLKGYPGNVGSEKSKAFRFAKEEIRFYTLSKVDVAILTNESLFDVVLAKMWTDFSGKAESSSADSFAYGHTKESFNTIKDAYTIYYKDEKQNKNLTSVSQLQELARSLALKEQFANLVASFLEYMVADTRIAPDDRYLVIPIDDLDLANDKTLAILEQLRIFLSAPQVIILTTVDIEKLLMCGTKKFSDELICRDNVEEYEKSHVRQYSDQYIAKVLPRNSRIYMPKYGGSEARQFALEYDKYVKLLMEGEPEKAEGTEPKEDVDYFTFIDMVMAKHLNLIVRYQDNLDSATESLRNIVNKTNELWMICQKYPAQATNFVFEWLDKEILISTNRIHDQKSITFMQELFAMSGDNYNEYIIDYFLNMFQEENEEGYGYGQLLCTLAEVRDNRSIKQDLLKELILFYSFQIAKFLDREDYDAVEHFFVRKDILSSYVNQKVLFKFEDDRVVDNLLALVLKCGKESKTAQEIMTQNIQHIVDVFKDFLFCDIEDVIANSKLEVTFNSGNTKKIPLAEEPEKTAAITVRTQKVVSRVSIDNFFKNVIRYNELFQKYIRWIYDELRKYKPDGETGLKKTEKVKKPTKKEYKDLLDAVSKNPASGVKEMAEWIERNGIETIYDLLPVQDVGVMLGVLERINQSTNLWYNFDEMIQVLSEAFVEEFEEAEQSCAYGELGYRKYSEKFKELMECIGWDKVSQEIKDRLAVTGQRLEDTAWLP